MSLVRKRPFYVPVAAFLAALLFHVALLPHAHAAPDTQAPRVLHAVVTKAVIGQNVDLKVQFQDESEIFEPKLYFRRVGELEYAAIDLTQGARGEWSGTIPATFVTRPIEYFLEAFDIMGNGPGRNGSPEKPHTINVVTRIEPTQTPQDPVGPRRIDPNPVGTPSGGGGTLQPVGVTETAAVTTPVYKKWWFWTIMVLLVGGAAAGATIGGLCASGAEFCQGGQSGPPTSVTVRLVGPDPRTGL